MTGRYTQMMTPEEITIDLVWGLYCHAVFDGKPIPVRQYFETKKAFYAGFSECFKIMNDIARDFSEEQAGAILQRIAEENQIFVAEMVRLYGKPHSPKH